MLATYAYDDLGRRTGVTLGNGALTSYGYDPVSRLASLTHDLAGTANDLTINGFAYNPASQIKALTRSNDAYAFTALGSGTTSTVTNGLNQLATVGGVAAAYDAKGNLTTDPASGRTYAYSSENLLTAQTNGTAATLAYDPLLRLSKVTAGATTKFGYDGVDLVAEGDGSNAILRRYVPGDGVDEPIVWYEGSGTTDRRFLHADERGSIVAVTDSSGSVIAKNTYDEYGMPSASNIGRFQYTGQKWIGEIRLYDYKARMYAPAQGRFVQTDPIGYGNGPNAYGYVASDPINARDATGTFGLFGGCPAGSSCTRTNPAASNAADYYANAGLRSAIEQTFPGVSQNGINQIAACVNNPASGVCSQTFEGGRHFWNAGVNYVHMPLSPSAPVAKEGVRTILIDNASMTKLITAHGPGAFDRGKSEIFGAWLLSPSVLTTILNPIVQSGRVNSYWGTPQLQIWGTTPWPLGNVPGYNDLPPVMGTHRGMIVIAPTSEAGVWRLVNFVPVRERD